MLIMLELSALSKQLQNTFICYELGILSVKLLDNILDSKTNLNYCIQLFISAKFMPEFTIICSSFKLQSNQLTFFENISSASCLYLYNSFSAASLTFCSISLMLTSWSSLEPVLTFCSKLIIAVLAAAIRSYRTPNNSQRETIMFKIRINMFEFSFWI